MTDDEMAETIMRELPAAYEIMPPDILCGYISVYRNDKRRKETTLKEIKTVLDWERTVPYRPYAIADCLTTQPPRRAEFESMYRCGPVGTANEHRVVVLERIGAMPPRAFCAAVTGDEMIRQVVFNRQASFAYTRVLSHRHGTNLRRQIVIVDLKGFSMAHLGSDFMKMTKLYIRTLLNVFPEASAGFYMINSPAIVRGGWVIVKALLDADTLSKCKVLGGPSSYEPLFKQLGITFTEGSTPLSECRPSWVAALREISPADVKKPFLTEAEAAVYASGLAAASSRKEAPSSVVPSLAAVEENTTKQGGEEAPIDSMSNAGNDSKSSSSGKSPLDVRARLPSERGSVAGAHAQAASIDRDAGVRMLIYALIFFLFCAVLAALTPPPPDGEI